MTRSVPPLPIIQDPAFLRKSRWVVSPANNSITMTFTKSQSWKQDHIHQIKSRLFAPECFCHSATKGTSPTESQLPPQQSPQGRPDLLRGPRLHSHVHPSSIHWGESFIPGTQTGPEHHSLLEGTSAPWKNTRLQVGAGNVQGELEASVKDWYWGGGRRTWSHPKEDKGFKHGMTGVSWRKCWPWIETYWMPKSMNS